MKKFLWSMLLLAPFVAAPLHAEEKTQDKPANNMEILRDKIRADKRLVVAANMQLTEGEAQGFWPVYDAYQKDLLGINQRVTKLIREYADSYNKGPMSDETAKKLVSEMLAIESAELDQKRAYVPKLEKVLPPLKVARYLQIENKIHAAIQFELAANIPVVQ